MSPLWILLTLLPILGGAERFNCRGRILGAYYADAKSGCKAFHVCVRVAGGSIRDFRFFCPPGTLFHQEAQTCTDWGDDDPLACPADIYDGQFDLYKIGSGFDTKKVSQENRDDESEFGLQRAETGDRRLSQNNGASSSSTDLRAAHSSDFFSGQRDRGRDDLLPPAPQAQQPISQTRQSFRRPTTFRPSTTTTQYTTIYQPPSQPLSQSSKANRYDQAPKRKVARKRPIYATTQPSTTLAPNTFAPQTYSEPIQNFNRRAPSQTTQNFASTVNIPPQYKDEYVEVSKVTPKQSRYFSNIASSTPFIQLSTEAPSNKKNGFIKSHNYEDQSTTGFNVNNENRPFKVQNSFSVVPDFTDENDFLRTKNYNSNVERGTNPTTIDLSTTTRSFVTTPGYRNVNSLSYEQEKKNYNHFSSSKQNYYNNPTTTPTTTVYTTTAGYVPSQNFNTIAYNTNNAFNAQTSNFADSGEDDGQYRPPEGEDDGQYRPELYERELLSGAHSLNIAASGNQLRDEQKTYNKNQLSRKSTAKTSPPRPFKPAPTATAITQTSRLPDVTYSTTIRPVQDNTQRTFDYYQTYTTTSRPLDSAAFDLTKSNSPSFDSTPTRITSTQPSRTFEPQRYQNRETAAPAIASAPVPKPTTRPKHFAKPANHKEDTSYDYAYYDSDPGFSEYDHIEEFGRTKTKA